MFFELVLERDKLRAGDCGGCAGQPFFFTARALLLLTSEHIYESESVRTTETTPSNVEYDARTLRFT